MVEPTQPQYVRVRYSNGGVFYVKPCNATDYVLAPVFLQFIVVSVFMYSALMMVFDVPFVAQMIFFGAGVVASFFWLTIWIFLYLSIQKNRRVISIFTPFLYVPMQLFNTATCEVVLRSFGSTYLEAPYGFLEFMLRTMIIIVCLDIFHGKFVAPFHPMYLGDTEPDKTPAAKQPAPPAAPPVTAPAAPAPTAQPVAMPAPPIAKEEAPQVQPDRPEPAQRVSIGSETFELPSLEYINSEDHYLMVHYANKSTMVRGRLRDVAAKIDVSCGVQINRSVWVAYAAIKFVEETSEKRLEVHLKDGTALRVAESRRVHFLHSYERFSTSRPST